jgi:hypothetical protein
VTEILDLSKVGAPRDTVRLPQKGNPDGKAHDFASPSDFGLLELHRLMSFKEKADLLGSLKKRTPKQEQELSRLLGEAVRLLVPSIDPDTLRMLGRPAREQVLLAWIGTYYAGDDEGDDPGEAASRRTTAASSRGSKPSTAATPKRGSTSRAGR